MKELFYKACILHLIVLLFPLAIIIAFLVLIWTGVPIIYRQKRVGKGGKVFILYKFRTMISNADQMKEQVRLLNEAKGAVFKIHNDPRFTSLGKFLSHIGLDELPQLFNVLKGDMVLIGPRPLPVDEVNKLESWQKKRHQMKPGIISPWIVNGYHSQSFNDWMESDIKYANNKCLLYDAKIFWGSLLFVYQMLRRELATLNKSKHIRMVSDRLSIRSYERLWQ